MKLLIDAGNTRIKWALVDDEGDWLRSGMLPVGQASELPGLFAESQGILQICVSNVAGEEVASHIRSTGIGQTAPVQFVVAREIQCGVRNGYSTADQLGSDRWAALIAAWHLVKGKCLVVNCGTAITIDTLTDQGRFLGGLILPGLELMQRSLVSATDQVKLDNVEPGQGKYVNFPMNTNDALLSGAIQAACGAIQRQYSLLDGGDVPVVLSGGAAGVLQEHLRHANLPLRIVDNLVLQGLWLISQELSV